MHPLMKRNKFFTIRELEMFIELGHQPKDFLNLLEEHKNMKVPDENPQKSGEILTKPIELRN